MNRNEAPCTLRALRELGYKWRKIKAVDRIECWVLFSHGDLDYGGVYWNGDGHDIRAVTPREYLAERSVDKFRGPTVEAVKKRATAIMAELRALVERKLVENPWTVVRLGSDSKQRRKIRRWGERCIAAARAEARKVTP